MFAVLLHDLARLGYVDCARTNWKVQDVVSWSSDVILLIGVSRWCVESGRAGVECEVRSVRRLGAVQPVYERCLLEGS